MINLARIDITIAGLARHYAHGDFSPAELVEAILDACRADAANPIWITLLTREQCLGYVQALPKQANAQLPLYGVPFAIKDNIDLEGVSTTAACPAFSYLPESSAFVVQRLIAAGAIPIGKTNMDQFATGLVGTRSPAPWGSCHNVFNAEMISGGSSSGSALAVAKGLVSFALGTDTAGSGRVPAALNNIVGWKPSRGLISCRGVVPACKSLDCVSIFALSAVDVNTVANCAVAFDAGDPYGRENTYGNGPRYFAENTQKLKLGVPAASQLEFFGDTAAPDVFGRNLEMLANLGHELIEIDFSPFLSAARLLYEGPWVSERYLAIEHMLQHKPEQVLPVIREIIAAGAALSARDVFKAHYQLQTHAQQARTELAKVDAIVSPTFGRAYSIAEIAEDPIGLNAKLGYYTNFMNLLDCAAVAVPAGFLPSGVGFGITFFQQAFSDKRLLSLAAQWQAHSELPLGVTALDYAQVKNNTVSPSLNIDVVVCGAHMRGLALNWQLTERGGTFVRRTHSAARYRLFALSGGPPHRPGMLRVPDNGQEIEVEIWSVPAANFGSFVAEIPYPLGIGKVELVDGSWHSGFVCDAAALQDAVDITHFGGWRRYLESV